MSARLPRLKPTLAPALYLALGLAPLAAAAQAAEPQATTAEAAAMPATPAPAPASSGQDDGAPQGPSGTTAAIATQASPDGPGPDAATTADDPGEPQRPPATTATTSIAPQALVAKIEVHDAGQPEPAESTAHRSIAQQVAAIGAALHAGDLATARRQLDTLATKLPARSLTLLRMQAWYAHANGDNAGAIALYRDIVARLPDDATAAINLAILEAGNGQPESARQRLQRLRALDTDSRRIERAIDQVGALLR